MVTYLELCKYSQDLCEELGIAFRFTQLSTEVPKPWSPLGLRLFACVGYILVTILQLIIQFVPPNKPKKHKSQSLTFKKTSPCRHPCHTQDPCEMIGPNFYALNNWSRMDWPPQVTWELGPGTPCEPVNKTKPCASYKWTGCSSIKIQPAVEVPKSLEINPCNLSRCPKSRKSSPDTGVNWPLYYTHTCRLFITVIPSAPVDWIPQTFSHGKKKHIQNRPMLHES